MADALRVTADNPVTGRQPPTWQSFATNLAVVRDQPGSRSRPTCHFGSEFDVQSQSWLQRPGELVAKPEPELVAKPESELVAKSGELVATSRRVGCNVPASWLQSPGELVAARQV